MTSDTKGIFISYRREEAAAHAGWLADRLSDRFGEHNVFRDIDTIEPGLDFVEAIERAVDSAEVLIVVIGKSWVAAADAAGQPRLQNPDDYVRREVGAALQRNIRVLPVLVQGASMPRADEMPDDLAALARRNAFELHDTSWRADVQRLVAALERVLVKPEEERRHTAPTAGEDKVEPPLTPEVPDLGDQTAFQGSSTAANRNQSSSIFGSAAAAIAGVMYGAVVPVVLGLMTLSETGAMLLSFLACIGTLVGVVGLYTQREVVGHRRLAKTGFVAAGLSLTLLTLLFLTLSIYGEPRDNDLLGAFVGICFLGGLLGLTVGFVLLGLAALRTRVLPVWSGLMLIGQGVLVPLGVTALILLGLVRSTQGPIVTLSLVSLTSGLLWLVVAYALLRTRGASQREVSV